MTSVFVYDKLRPDDGSLFCFTTAPTMDMTKPYIPIPAVGTLITFGHLDRPDPEKWRQEKIDDMDLLRGTKWRVIEISYQMSWSDRLALGQWDATISVYVVEGIVEGE